MDIIINVAKKNLFYFPLWGPSEYLHKVSIVRSFYACEDIWSIEGYKYMTETHTHAEADEFRPSRTLAWACLFVLFTVGRHTIFSLLFSL